LLLDAQGANLLLQAGSQLAAPGGSVELSGRNVTVAAGALVSTSAQAPAGPVPAPGTTTAPAEAPTDPAAVATTAPTPETPVLPAPAAAQIAAAGLDGGGIRISASGDANIAGQIKALGVAATGSGTAASGGSGKGGRIEITGQRVALKGAALDASGPAGGGTVLLGGDVRGANPEVPNANTTSVDAASTVRADALAKGDGGKVVAYAADSTSAHGLISARGGPGGGNGGFVETSGGYLDVRRAPEVGAQLGQGGAWLIDPQDIVIGPSIEWLSTGSFQTNDGKDEIWQLRRGDSVNSQPAFSSRVSPNWSVNDSLSSWISDTRDYEITPSDIGSFTFFAKFSISSLPPAESSATLTTYADDRVTALKINEIDVNIRSTPNTLFGQPAQGLNLSTSLFRVGENKIEAVVYNEGVRQAQNPVAFRALFNGDLRIELPAPATKYVVVNVDGHTTTFTPSNLNQASWLSSLTISNSLNQGSNVIVDTTSNGTGSGNITVNSPIIKTAGGNASLTLNAHNNIVLNSNISSTSAALNLNLNADIDGNGSGATSLASGASLNLNGGTATANGPISMATNSKIKDAQIVASGINSDGGILDNMLSLNVDNLRLNGGSLQANGTATVKALDLISGSISGSGDLQVTQSFNRSGGTIDGNFSKLSITQVSGSLTPGALRAVGPVTLLAPSGQLTLDAPITASTVLARGSSGITLSGAAVLTARAPSGRAITLDAGSGAFLNNSTSGAEALSKQPGATWAIYADNPTSTPSVNLGGLPYSFKQYNQTFNANQESNPILGSGSGLFFANSPTISVNLTSQVRKTYDGTNAANLVGSNYNITGTSADDTIIINNPSGAYNDKNVGTGKLVSVSELSITSATDTATAVPVYGYILGNSTANASIGTITKAPLTITAASDSRVYNGTTSSSGVPAVTSGQVFSGDMLSGLSQVFDIKNVLGTNQSTLKVSGGYTLNDGNNGNNYAVSLATASGTITPFDLPVTGLLANNKVYDATTVAPLGGSAAVSPFSGDEVNVGGTAAGAFSDKNVGIDKAVTVTGVTIAGNDAGNYNLLPLTNLKAAITPAPLQISASSDSKIYDGTTQSSLAPKITQGGLWGDDRLTGLAQTYESKNALGAGQSKLIVSAYTLSDGNNGSNYVLSFLSGPGTINRASVTPSFAIKSKQYDGSVAAEIAGNSLQGGLASDEVFMVGASALFDNAYAANDKLVTITGYTLSGQDADNYQLSSPTATSTASITTQQDNGALPSNEEPIKNKEANPAVGLQLSKLSSPTASKSVDVDISNIVLLPPGASVLESTPSGSTQSQPTPTAASATSSVPNQSQPTASATAVTTSSATQEYQESDNRSAEDAKTSLGLSSAPSSEAISPARLQLVMQSAASFIRKYPVRTLNQ